MTAHVGLATGDPEWYTPAEYVRAARAAMGGIDLDPASCTVANEVVRATEFFTAEVDGLGLPWAGRVWMNPPYQAAAIRKFVGRLCDSYTTGAVTQACVLTNNSTDTEWFRHLARHASAVCLIRGRIRFWHPDKRSCNPLQGQAVTYLGDRVKQFTRAFSPFGIVTLTTSSVTAGTCATCNTTVVGARADARYCSNACKQKAYRQRRAAS